jgi:hypothetical protein
MTMKPWVCSAFAKQDKRLLILGESWYGDFELNDEVRFIQTWIARKPPGCSDRFFSRIYNAGNSTPAAKATERERREFWEKVAFTNLVSESVGRAARIRPSDVHWAKGIRRLRLLLPRLKCDRVLILGREAASYAKPVIDHFGILSVSCPHPSGYGVTTEVLRRKWEEVTR